MHTIQSWLNVVMMAWSMPMMDHFWGLRLKELIPGLLLGTLTVALTAAGAWLLQRQSNNSDKPEPDLRSPPRWAIEALAIGGLGALGGVLPIILSNRTVVFDRFSHYALPASLAAAVFVVGLIGCISSYRIRLTLLSVLTALAIITHYSVSMQAVNEEEKIQQFWWQISWRASRLKAGTTLLVQYPDIGYSEDQEVVWGPANLIYFPNYRDTMPVRYKISALSKIGSTAIEVLGNGGEEWGYRTHTAEIDYNNLLVISQPAETSCVHVIDGNQPVLSLADSDRILLLGKRSKITNIGVGGPQPNLPEILFDREPEHGWCYYYQKAEVARQHELLYKM